MKFGICKYSSIELVGAINKFFEALHRHFKKAPNRRILQGAEARGHQSFSVTMIHIHQMVAAKQMAPRTSWPKVKHEIVA